MLHPSPSDHLRYSSIRGSEENSLTSNIARDYWSRYSSDCDVFARARKYPRKDHYRRRVRRGGTLPLSDLL